MFRIGLPPPIRCRITKSPALASPNCTQIQPLSYQVDSFSSTKPKQFSYLTAFRHSIAIHSEKKQAEQYVSLVIEALDPEMSAVWLKVLMGYLSKKMLESWADL